jgi:hypothetical protein
VGRGLAEHEAGKQGGEQGAVTLGHGTSPDRTEVKANQG